MIKTELSKFLLTLVIALSCLLLFLFEETDEIIDKLTDAE